MKSTTYYYFPLFIAVALFVIMPVSANPLISETFQNGASGVFTKVYDGGYGGTCTVACSNEACYLDVGSYATCANAASTPATYWAYTCIQSFGATYTNIYWFDSNWNYIASSNVNEATGSRYEFKLIGGDMLWYRDGVYQGIAVDHTSWSGAAPAHMGIGDPSHSERILIDDFMIGANYLDVSDHEMLDTPPSSWLLVKDPTTGVYGVFNGAGVQVRTYPFYGRYVKQDATTPQVINFLNTEGRVIDTTTVTAMTGTVSWDNRLLYSNSSPYGLCRMQFAEGLPVGYIGSTVANSTAVSLTFNKDTYSQGDTAILSRSIASGYWNPTDYEYHIAVVDIYGEFVGSNITVSTSSGDSSLVFSSTDFPPMVYYAELIRVNKLTGEEQLLAYDNAAISSYVPVSGHCYDGNSTLPLPGVLYNISQLSTWTNGTTGFDGNFSSSGWLTGSAIHYYFTKTGYTPFNYSFTPLSARNVSLNISLCPSTPLTSGRAIGGIARESTYGSYIAGVNISVRNVSTGEIYTTSTNARGFYICDSGSQCFASLTPSRLYGIQGSKTGFANSTEYTKAAPP